MKTYLRYASDPNKITTTNLFAARRPCPFSTQPEIRPAEFERHINLIKCYFLESLPRLIALNMAIVVAFKFLQLLKTDNKRDSLFTNSKRALETKSLGRYSSMPAHDTVTHVGSLDRFEDYQGMQGSHFYCMHHALII